MTSTITHALGTIVPTVVNGYTATRTAETVVHRIINRSEPDVTFRPAGLRTGSLRCVFATESEAKAAYGVLSDPQVFALADDDVPTVDMSFVVADGDIEISLDPDTRRVWVVTVPFVEVNP